MADSQFGSKGFKMLNERQITWASQHDWFIDADVTGVMVNEILVYSDGTVIENVKSFSDFKALRDWAGY